MTEPIRGKVAQVLNSREIVINVGATNGVVVGMRFEVVDSKGEDIRDPDTNELLGSIDRPKVKVRIVKVKDKLSLAATQEKRVNVGGQWGIGDFSRMLMPPKWVTKYETLKTEEKTWEDLAEGESYVKIGDPVVQIVEGSEVEQKNANGQQKFV